MAKDPRFVLEVVDGFKGVDAGDIAILEAKKQIFEVFMSILDVLADKQEVWLEGSEDGEMPGARDDIKFT